MERRKGRGTIRFAAIRPAPSFHMEYSLDPVPAASAVEERVGDGASEPGAHNHPPEVDGIDIRVIGCPGCIEDERRAWLQRVDPGHDHPWIRR